MGMIMNKSGKFKDRHPKAYKVIRVVTMLLFCLSFFFVGVFIGLTFNVARDYKEGYTCGRIDRLFNPRFDFSSIAMLPLDYNNVPSFIEVPATSSSSIFLRDIPDYMNCYFTFAFPSMSVPLGLVKGDLSTDFVQSNFSLSRVCVPEPFSNEFDIRPFCESISLIPREITRRFNTHSLVFSKSYIFGLSSVSYTLSNISSHYSLSTVADFYNILRSFSNSLDWERLLNIYDIQAVTTYWGAENTIDGYLPNVGTLTLASSSYLDIEFPVYNHGGKKYVFPLIVCWQSLTHASPDFVSGFSYYASFLYQDFYSAGYDDGLTNGFSLGYDKGFNDAIDSGHGINIDWLLSFSNGFLSMPIFGGVTLGNFLMVGIMLASFGGLLKLFFGG